MLLLAAVMAVVTLANSYPYNPRRLFAAIGVVLTVVAGFGAAAGYVVGLRAHRDRCHNLTPPASHWAAALLLTGFAMLIVGLALRTATEWAPMLMVAVGDAGVVGYACVGSFGSQDRAIAVLFATHGVCVAVGTWWSWRARDRDATARAKASEAGRLLVGGLIAVILLQVASSSQPASNPVLTNSNLGVVLIATALAVALGTGYTKYVEAMATDSDPARTPPRSNIPPTVRAGRVAITRQYRALRQAAIRPRTAVIPPESADDNDELRQPPTEDSPAEDGDSRA